MRGGALDCILARVRHEDCGFSSPCWVWTGPLNENGYGRSSVRGLSKRIRIHRATYGLVVGPIPDGLVIDHLCRNRACCNPSHLEAVTQQENERRKLCVTMTPCEHGARRSKCVPCHARYHREWKARKRAKAKALAADRVEMSFA